MSVDKKIKKFDQAFASFAGQVLNTPAKDAIARALSDPKLYKRLIEDYWNKNIFGVKHAA